MSSQQERFEDVFDEEIINRFHSSEDFFQFARSKRGLKLHQYQIAEIQENNRHNVREQKLQMLMLWKQKRGSRASPELIRDVYDNYFGRKVQSDASKVTDDAAPSPVVPEENIDGGPIKNVTNILGPIHGPVVMGSEQVILGGAANAPNPLIDQNVPLLKPSSSEITRAKCLIKIGDCELEFPTHCVKENTKVNPFYKVDPTPPPDGYVAASGALSFSALFQGQKNVKLTLPTWCSTSQSVDVGIFTKDEEENWKGLEHPILTHEGHLELCYRQLDNFAAFLPKESLEKVEFKISCFLFNNADGKFAMGFCLYDRAVENVFQYRLKEENFVPTIKSLEPLTASLGDEIFFKITPGQHMQNTYFEVDEQFVSSFQGYISYCNLDKSASSPVYKITHKSKRDGKIVAKNSYDIHEKESGEQVTRDVPDIKFHGKVEAGTIIGQAKDVDIDMRQLDKGDDASEEPFRKQSKLTYKELQKHGDRAFGKIEKIKSGTSDGQTEGKHQPVKVAFLGDVKAGNIITGATNVRIDKRKVKKKKKKDTAERLVVPEQNKVDDSTSEKRQKFHEEGGKSNQAKPIWDDCEKEREENGSKDGSETHQDQHSLHEQSEQQNEAVPIWQDCEKKEEKKDDPWNQSKESTETENVVRPRKKQKSERDLKTEGDGEKDNPLDNANFGRDETMCFIFFLLLISLLALYYYFLK